MLNFFEIFKLSLLAVLHVKSNTACIFAASVTGMSTSSGTLRNYGPSHETPTLDNHS